VSTTHQEEAARAVEAALRETGAIVITRAEANERLPSELRECGVGACVRDVLRHLKGDFAVGVAIWNQGNPPKPVHVTVSLIRDDDVKYEHTAVVTDDNVPAAARLAFASARLRSSLGPGPWLVVRGVPVGASVLVDGREVGVLPWLGRSEPGVHQVTVQLDGYHAYRETIEVPANPNAQQIVGIRLFEEHMNYGANARHDGPQSSKASPWNFVIAGGLAAAAAPALITSLTTAAQDGRCIENRPDGTCKQAHFGTRSGLLLAFGIAAVGGSLYFAGFTPLKVKVDVEAERHGAGVQVRGEF
jgi:hypothetical protein